MRSPGRDSSRQEVTQASKKRSRSTKPLAAACKRGSILQAEAAGSFKLRVPSDDDVHQSSGNKDCQRICREKPNTLESRRDGRVESCCAVPEQRNRVCQNRSRGMNL